MKRSFLSLSFLLFIFFTFSQTGKHVIFISVDGFRPDFYLDSTRPTPTIQEMMKTGTYAKGVNSVFPAMTYPSHTTIISGVQPVDHGIYSNDMFEPEGKTGKIYWNYNQIKVPTLLGAAQQKGMKVAAIYWPVSAEAPVAYNVPDIGSRGDSIFEAYTKPEGFNSFIRKDLFGGVAKFDHGKNVNIARIAAYVIQKDQPDLMVIHLFAIDHAAHMNGREGKDVTEAVADADSAVAIILEAVKAARIEANTVVMVGGDHGFENTSRSISPNVWLAQAGLMIDNKSDWKAQFFTVGGSAHLYIKNNDKQVLQQVTTLLSELPDSAKQYFKIVDKKKLDEIGASPELQLALSGVNGGSFGSAYQGDAIKPGKGGGHGHFPDTKNIQTGFVASGPGITKGGVINEMNLRDIAPTIAKLLGLNFPSAKGKIPVGLLK